MLGKQPNMTIAAPPTPEAAPTPPSFAAAGVQSAGARTGAAAKGGLASTILTSGQGDLMPANTAKKTLLGQ